MGHNDTAFADAASTMSAETNRIARIIDEPANC